MWILCNIYDILIFLGSRKGHWCEDRHRDQRLAKYLLFDKFQSLWHVVVLNHSAVPSNKLLYPYYDIYRLLSEFIVWIFAKLFSLNASNSLKFDTSINCQDRYSRLHPFLPTNYISLDLFQFQFWSPALLLWVGSVAGYVSGRSISMVDRLFCISKIFKFWNILGIQYEEFIRNWYQILEKKSKTDNKYDSKIIGSLEEF